MIFPPNYPIALTDRQIQINFPNLKKGLNFKFTSLRTTKYNCIAWSLENDSYWDQQIDYRGMTLVDATTYIGYFQKKGFVITTDRAFEVYKVKIAVYIDTKTFPHEFKHVARLLENGNWTSKLGDFEDIEHETPEDLTGDFYGRQIIIMEKFI